MAFRDVLSALRASWWLLVTGVVIGGTAALSLSWLVPPGYTSHMQFFVSTTGSTSTSDIYTGSQFSQQRVASYAQLLTGEELSRRVISQLGLTVAPRQLADEIKATPVTDTVLLDASVTDRSAVRAREIAQALGTQFAVMVNELETPPGDGAAPVKVTVVQNPELPTSPSSPRIPRNLVLGVAGGLVLGAAGAISRVQLDRSVRDADELATLAGAPVIATIIRDDSLEKRHTIDGGTGGRTAEDYRQLRTNLQFLKVDDPPKVIMVSSAVPAEGKTTVVVNLALALADAGRSVVIVEADLRRPKVTGYLAMVGGAGLTNILAGTAEIDDVLQPYRDGLVVLAAGPTPPNPGELLGSVHMSALLDKLRAQFDIVLIDVPPLLPVADASALASATDGVLLSVRYGKTHKDQLEQAAATLNRVGGKTLGVILNVVPPKSQGASAYGYGYSYGYDRKHAKGAKDGARKGRPRAEG